MFFKIEKSGCCEHKGLVQLRFDLFLEQNDYRYGDFYIQCPILPIEGYLGKLNEMGNPVDEADYNKWLESLPTEWIHTPFCCHFVYVGPSITNEEILFLGQCSLDAAYKDFQADSLGKTKNVYENGTKTPVWNTFLSADSMARIETIKSTKFTNTVKP